MKPTVRALASILGLGCSLALDGCGVRCVNTVVETIANPGASLTAVLYTRACGATTGPSSHVSIAGRDESVVDVGNVVVLKDPVSNAETSVTTRIRWVSADTLEVSLLRGRSIQSRSEHVRGVVVLFTIHADRDR